LKQKKKPNNESGLCQCGCGQSTSIATRNHTQHQFIKGKPIRYIRGHFKWGPVNAWACPHIDQKHQAKGLCNLCYQRSRCEDAKKRYHARKEKMGAKEYWTYRHALYLRSRYHISPEQYEFMLDSQNHRCICGREFNRQGTKWLLPHIDHDHKCCSKGISCGKCIRGLLCFRCNTVLGLLEPDPHLLPYYLREYLAKFIS